MFSTIMADEYSDLRSANLAPLREKNTKAKYHHFRAVHPGQLGQPHYVPSSNSMFPLMAFFTLPLPQCPVAILTKKMMWEAGLWGIQGCTHGHRCPDKKLRMFINRTEAQERKARYEGRSWEKKGRYSDLIAGTMDDIDYEDMARMDAESALIEAFFDDGDDVIDECGGLCWGLDRPVNIGMLVDGARVDRRLRNGNGRGLRDWTSVGDEWESEWEYEVVEDDDVVSDFELV